MFLSSLFQPTLSPSPSHFSTGIQPSYSLSESLSTQVFPQLHSLKDRNIRFIRQTLSQPELSYFFILSFQTHLLAVCLLSPLMAVVVEGRIGKIALAHAYSSRSQPPLQPTIQSTPRSVPPSHPPTHHPSTLLLPSINLTLHPSIHPPTNHPSTHCLILLDIATSTALMS